MNGWSYLILASLALSAGAYGAEAGVKAAFPTERPRAASYIRPRDGESLWISPPGFNWWRLEPGRETRGKVVYQLVICDAAGKAVYQSPLLEEPAHVPNRALAPGDYTWTVRALSKGGEHLADWPTRRFTIETGADEQPMEDAAALLARVPREHPRLIFPKAELDEVRATLGTTRREAFEELRRRADEIFTAQPVPAEPEYVPLMKSERGSADYNTARYMYGRFKGRWRAGNMAMVRAALYYTLTGERKYADAARARLLALAEWDPAGFSSVLNNGFDDLGLHLLRTMPRTYDWVYDTMSDGERAKVRGVLKARAEESYKRLYEKADYLYMPSESHNGRQPGYLMEHAIALAHEEPEAAARWLRYVMTAAMTVYPHWLGSDGGWAEGPAYGLGYNSLYMPGWEALRKATGFDLWRRPRYAGVRKFFMYLTSWEAEYFSFGDIAHGAPSKRAASLRGLIQFHALRYRDPAARWWVSALRDYHGEPTAGEPLETILLPDDLAPAKPADFSPDAVFRGVGWAVFHGDFFAPKRDLLVQFKSSPYGAVSHSHADQNSFLILKNGKAMAIPSGRRWPSHGCEFHKQYVRQTVSNNSVLVDGTGQATERGKPGGSIADFQSTPRFGYALGDAGPTYEGRLTTFRRHILMARPSALIVVDELAAPKPARFDWLMHTIEKMALDEDAQSVLVTRESEKMRVRLFTDGGMSLAQTDAWPLDPRTGFKVLMKKPVPFPKQWHLTATPREKTAARRIAAVFEFAEGGAWPRCEIQRQGSVVNVIGGEGAEAWTVRIDLDTGAKSVLRAESAGAGGTVEASAE